MTSVNSAILKLRHGPTLTSPCNNCLYSSNIKTDLALTGDSRYRSPQCITDLPANEMFDGLSKISIFVVPGKAICLVPSRFHQ